MYEFLECELRVAARLLAEVLVPQPEWVSGDGDDFLESCEELGPETVGFSVSTLSLLFLLRNRFRDFIESLLPNFLYADVGVAVMPPLVLES